MKGNYDDILYLNPPVSQVHPKQPMEKRAAQFAPFAALVGYEEAIQETGRHTESKPTLSKDKRDLFNQQLSLLSSAPEMVGVIEVTYFTPDKKKEGGRVCFLRDEVSKVDAESQTIYFKGGTSLPFSALLELSFEGFSAED